MDLSRRHLLAAGAGLVTAACTDAAPTQTAATTARPTPTRTATQATPTDRWRAGAIAPAALLSAYAHDWVMIVQPLQLHVSADKTWVGSVYRIGYFQGKGGTKVAEVAGSKKQFSNRAPNPTTRAVVAGWPVVAEVDTTGWTSGLYTVVGRCEDGSQNSALVVAPHTRCDRGAI